MLGLNVTLSLKNKRGGASAANPFEKSPRTFIESPQQVILIQGASTLLYASNGDGGVLKMNGDEVTFYPNTAVAFFYYSWNGSSWVYVGLKTQGQSSNVTSFSHSTFNITNWNNAVFFAKNYP